MKKSQILAALALAFTLGVVAPVMAANTYAAEDITARAEYTRTKCDVLNAIASIKGYDLYEKYAALMKADGEAIAATSVTTAISNIESALLVATSGSFVTFPAGTNLADAIATARTSLTAEEQVRFDLWTKLYDDYEANNDSALLGDILNLDGGFNQALTANQIRTVISSKTGYSNGTIDTEASNYWDIFDALKVGRATLAAIRTLGQDAKAIYTADSAAIDAAIAAENLAGIRAFYVTAGASYKADIIAFQALAARIDAIETTTPSLISDGDVRANYDLLFGQTTSLNTLLGTFTDNAGAKKSLSEIPAVIATVCTNGNVTEDPTNPENPGNNQGDNNQGNTETPGSTDNNQGGQGAASEDKNGAPNTGVVAEGADASAKSSVSIMAGISSFITAAGSALVAIRRGRKA